MFKRLAAAALAASLGALAQTNMRAAQATDKEKIADALRAGPAFITGTDEDVKPQWITHTPLLPSQSLMFATVS